MANFASLSIVDSLQQRVFSGPSCREDAMYRDSTCLEKLERFFFAAMLRGYASSQEANPHPTREKWKQNACVEGSLMLVDEWCKEGGRTIISSEGFPLWVMTYHGSYVEEAIPFLKDVLSLTYREGSFFGGRGVRRASAKDNPSLFYYNQCTGNFMEFTFAEKIDNLAKPAYFGHHKGWGGLLVPVNQLSLLMR